MDSLVWRVASRFFRAGRPLASSLPEYAQLIAEDGSKAVRWKKAFLANTARDAKAGHAKVLDELKKTRGDESNPQQAAANARYRKDADTLLASLLKVLHEIDGKFTQALGHDLSIVCHDLHNEYWDPEMFADGQTKADYGAIPMDSLFEVCSKAWSTYMEFWRRFLAKWDMGSMNITLDSIIPAEMRKELRAAEMHINTGFYRDLMDKGLDQAFATYHKAIQDLSHKVTTPPPHGGSALSVGAGLSALMGEAEKAGDKWTVDFIKSLHRQMDTKRPFSDKQKQVLEGKFDQYGIPHVNYSISW